MTITTTTATKTKICFMLLKIAISIAITVILILYSWIYLSIEPSLAEQSYLGHDFNLSGSGLGQSCLNCHIPHHANNAITDAPLWYHQVTTASYTTYTSPTLDATVGQPNTVSRLCLSCHDGTVAIDAYGGSFGHTFMTGSDNLTTDLRGSHPISFIYNTNLATIDQDLYNPTSSPSGLGGTIADDLLYMGETLECTSCHDVHNKYGNDHLLIKNNTGSALCLTCHDK